MRYVNAFIAFAAGVIVLAGYFVPALGGLQAMLLNWAMILVGAAGLVGVFNLILVHGDKIRRREKGGGYSALLIIALAAVFFFGMVLGPDHITMHIVLDGIILPAEAMLMGLLTVTLLYAGIRLLRRRADLMAVVFLLVSAMVLFGSATLPFGDMPVIGTLIRPWMTEVWAMGGARGILIGVALGTLTTGLRVLFGLDRPYGGK
jgi:hypothetical protein